MKALILQFSAASHFDYPALLRSAGIDEISTCTDQIGAFSFLRESSYTLALSESDAVHIFSHLSLVRALSTTFPSTGQIALTATSSRTEDDDYLSSQNLAVDFLQAGADDFMIKSNISERELLLRIQSVINRATRSSGFNSSRNSMHLEAGNIRLDLVSRTAYLRPAPDQDWEPIHLSPVQFQYLTLFLQTPGRTFTREFLLSQIHDKETIPQAVDAHIGRLRTLIKSIAQDYAPIQTARKEGYFFSPD